MPDIEFKIKGLTRTDVQRRRNKEQSQRSGSFTRISRLWTSQPLAPRIFVGILTALAGLYLIQWVYVFAEKHGPSTMAYGQVFTARNVIVLQDKSGSMGEREKVRLQTMMNHLARAGIKVDAPFLTDGGGFSIAGSTDSLDGLEQALRTNPTADTIFVFSDFKQETQGWDYHDQAGFQRLEQLLGQRNRRLYLGTVNRMPPAELIQIAKDSGGSLLVIN